MTRFTSAMDELTDGRTKHFIESLNRKRRAINDERYDENKHGAHTHNVTSVAASSIVTKSGVRLAEVRKASCA